MGRTVRRHKDDEDEPIEYDWTPQHQCGEPMRYIGGSRRMYCPRCDLKKARLANSVASYIAEHWEAFRERMAEVDEALTDLVERAEGTVLCGSDGQSVNNLYFCFSELWDEALLIEHALQERRGDRTPPEEVGPPKPQGKRRVSIRIEEVAGEGLEP